MLLWVADKINSVQHTKRSSNVFGGFIFLNVLLFRNPKILFATTTVTTTTVSTSAVCYVPTSAVSTGLLGCKKKKKKSLNIVDKAPKSSPEILPSPSSVQVEASQVLNFC